MEYIDFGFKIFETLEQKGEIEKLAIIKTSKGKVIPQKTMLNQIDN